ncbi:hypothetical protein LAZ67_10004124 [Cordylochernes scorpioides]|uniref:Uncharacterized protein n=1 Tax=Cordylochernes scorpioides TaxID=51811 RepID=A0ABY6KXG1_9ARAC|nr:hypothetical protein LAZ67_10004124 [Cordylochernes scorpioides]
MTCMHTCVPQKAHPYHFGYKADNVGHKGHHGGSHYRHESGDGHGKVHGSYGYVDEHGNKRHVDYVADKHGFRANVKTNEPGTSNQHPAAVHVEHEGGHHGYQGEGGQHGYHGDDGHHGYQGEGGHHGYHGEDMHGYHH